MSKTIEVSRCHSVLDMLLDEDRHIWAGHVISNRCRT